MTKFGVRRQAYHFAWCVPIGVGREEAGMVRRVSVRCGDVVSSGYRGKVEDC